MLSIQMRYFISVAESGSLSAASETLGVATSAISRIVHQLEDQVGTPLFDRHSRGMRLTNAGLVLLSYVRKSMQDLEWVLMRIQGFQENPQTTIRVACTAGLALDLMPNLFSRFYQQHPEVKFVLSLGTVMETMHRIRNGEVDVALQFALTPEPQVDIIISLPAPVLFAMTNNHPLATQAEVDLADVATYPLVLSDQSMTIRQLLDLACRMRGITLEPVLCCNDIAPQYDFLISIPEAILFTSFYSLPYKNQEGKLCFKMLDIAQLHQRSLQVQAMLNRPRAPIVQAFLDFLCEELKILRSEHPPNTTRSVIGEPVATYQLF